MWYKCIYSWCLFPEQHVNTVVVLEIVVSTAQTILEPKQAMACRATVIIRSPCDTFHLSSLFESVVMLQTRRAPRVEPNFSMAVYFSPLVIPVSLFLPVVRVSTCR